MGCEEVVTFLIPTLNERDGIGPVIDEIKSLGFNKILVVDGNSTDGTPEIAKEKGEVGESLTTGASWRARVSTSRFSTAMLL